MPRISSAVGVKPADDRVFIGRDNARRDRLEQRLGQRLLHGDLLIEKRVLQDGGDVLREQHQVLEVWVIEPLPSHAMADEQPPNDAAASVQRDNDFRSECIERAAHQRAVRLLCVRQPAARDEMRVQLEPTDQRVTFAVFDVVCLRQTTQPRAQAIAIALPDAREDADPRDARRIGNAFDDVGEQ
jgi:hypothetical protein